MNGNDGKATGLLISWFAERGFGWVRPDAGGGRDAFLHISQYPDGDEPMVGRRLRFEVVESPRGPRVVQVEVLDTGNGNGTRL